MPFPLLHAAVRIGQQSYCLSRRLNLQFPVDDLGIAGDRIVSEAHGGADLLEREPLGKVPQHFALTWGKPGEEALRFWIAAQGADEGFRDHAGDRWRFVAIQFANRLQNVLGSRL